jgi:hypothetical protein
MDYWEAWSPTVKATWHSTCVNQKLSCAGGDLGNGTQIIGGSEPAGGWTKHQLVALSSIPGTTTTTTPPTTTTTTQTCPDGSVILSTQTCPTPTATKPGKGRGGKK